MSGLSENAKRVLEARYLRHGAKGQIIETAGQLFERVARAVSEAELIHGTTAEARCGKSVSKMYLQISTSFLILQR